MSTDSSYLGLTSLGLTENLNKVRNYRLLLNYCLGKTKVTIFLQEFCYDGEVDENNKPFGYGIAINGDEILSGTWVDGERHGICNSKPMINSNFVYLEINLSGNFVQVS